MLKRLEEMLKEEENSTMAVVSCRVPKDVFAKIQKEAKRLKKTESEIVRAAIKIGLEEK